MEERAEQNYYTVCVDNLHFDDKSAETNLHIGLLIFTQLFV